MIYIAPPSLIQAAQTIYKANHQEILASYSQMNLDELEHERQRLIVWMIEVANAEREYRRQLSDRSPGIENNKYLAQFGEFSRKHTQVMEWMHKRRKEEQQIAFSL